MKSLVRRLRRAAGPDRAAPTDRQLLERFVSRRDDNAFEELVRRHGPMVFGVCRRVLVRAEDAEDAFQATFLVLAKKAASLRWGDRVGNWLYGVAYRAAREAFAHRARRLAKERPMSEAAEPEAKAAAESTADLRALLDEELSRLPDKYRAAVVLCELEGRSRREAATELGIPEGTLSSRLATARQMLARRLTARGVTLPAAAVAGVLAEATASARLPMALVALTRGETSLGAQVIVEGVLRSMFIQKLKAVGALFLLVGALAGGAGTVARAGRGDDKPAAARAASGAPATPTKESGAAPRAESGEEAESSPQGKMAAQLRVQLVQFENNWDAQTTFRDALEELSIRQGLSFRLREDAFVDRETKKVVPDIAATPIADRAGGIPKIKDIRLDDVLNLIFYEVRRKHPPECAPVLLARQDHFEVTSLRAAKLEILGEEGGVLPPLATHGFDKVPLSVALNRVADVVYPLNVVLDPRAGDKAKVPISARFANMPVDTAVRLLADMADLQTVRIDNVIYVTTRENAERMQSAPARPR